MSSPQRLDRRPSTSCPSRTSLRAACGIVAILAAAGCGSTGPKRDARVDEVRELVRVGQFEQAVVRADALADARPDDAALAEVRRDALVALMLERARRLSFDDQDEAALEQVEAALDLDPSCASAAEWRERIVGKLSYTWYLRGRAADARRDFLEAVDAIERSLAYDPDNELAAAKLEEIQTMLGRRKEYSEAYYNGGVRALVDSRLPESRASFESSRKYDDGDIARTERRLAEVNRERAVAQKQLAERQAAVGYWRSAHRAIDVALELDPELAEGEELRELYGTEAHVADLRRTADIARLRGEYDRARELLAEARGSTRDQLEEVDAELLGVDEAEAQGQYELALDLEHDFRFPEAVEAYRLLLSKREFYKDARARVGTLEDTISEAAELYARVETAETDQERLELLRQIELIWPEYRDVGERIEALRTAQ